MNKRRALLSVILLLALCLTLAGCNSRITTGYEVIARLDREEFSVAFRQGDALCDIVSAAMQELAAEGLLSRLSSQYLGADYTCLEGRTGAVAATHLLIEEERRLLVGVQDGAAPLCSKDDSGNFIGLIPDMVAAAAARLGWEVHYIEIRSEDVAVELASGNVDCAWLPASYAETGDYSLSPGWMENAHLLVTRRGSGLTKVRQLKGKNIGLTDDTALRALKNGTKIYDSVTVWNYSDIRSCFTALAAGECDAIVIDSIVSAHYLN